jgi:ABC-type nitrate/sulfonate/bicarbonate transport system ATPase subunit
MDEPFSALDVLTAENLRGELMELWLGRKIPTKSIFLVTHNIEEAVTLADRIIVLGRNPAKVRADFRVPLKHSAIWPVPRSQPRERNSAEFLLYVDYIYKLMTQPELTDFTNERNGAILSLRPRERRLRKPIFDSERTLPQSCSGACHAPAADE